jgi:outer membrane murein-binding lipoprotein Lpp
MHRPILFLAALLSLAAPAAGQETPAPSGRYQIAPDEDGFVRLDTRTGAMTHCGKREGSWRCDVLAEERSDLEQRLEALAGKVDALSAEVARLADRLAAVEAEPGAAQSPGAAPSPEAREEDFDEALSFAERLMRRFFDMVRELKSEEPPTRT